MMCFRHSDWLTCAASIVLPAPLAPARNVGRPAPRLVSKRKEKRSVLAVGTIISYTGTLEGYLARRGGEDGDV